MLGGAWLLSLSAGPAAALLLLLLILPALLHSVQAVAKGRGGCAGVNTLARAHTHTRTHTHTQTQAAAKGGEGDARGVHGQTPIARIL